MGLIRICLRFRIALSLLSLWPAIHGYAQTPADFQIPPSVRPNSTIVLGFLGGFEDWDDPHRGVRKVALHLRSYALPKLYVETLENRHQSLALPLLLHAGVKPGARLRIILFGQSWGGAAVVKTARQLQSLGIPVALTIQVDSVGLHDAVIPSNVRLAANIYQRDLIGIQGRTEIRPEDPSRTAILENTRLSYLFRPYSTLNSADVDWPRRIFGGSHAKLEADSLVWRHVESLILQITNGKL